MNFIKPQLGGIILFNIHVFVSNIEAGFDETLFISSLTGSLLNGRIYLPKGCLLRKPIYANNKKERKKQ